MAVLAVLAVLTVNTLDYDARGQRFDSRGGHMTLNFSTAVLKVLRKMPPKTKKQKNM